MRKEGGKNRSECICSRLSPLKCERYSNLRSFSLENERDHNLPVTRIITSKLLQILPMLLHSPVYHRARTHDKEQNTWSDIHLVHAYSWCEGWFLTSPASRHNGENHPTEDLEEVVGKRDQVEAVPIGNGALSASLWS